MTADSMRILLVDDHTETLSVMAKLLEMSGYSVNTATTVSGALQVASQFPCDLLISDVGLPDRTGYDLMREVRELYDVKGIALTGYTEDEDVKEAARAGFAKHLKKPVSFDALLSAIRDVGAKSEKPA